MFNQFSGGAAKKQPEDPARRAHRRANRMSLLILAVIFIGGTVYWMADGSGRSITSQVGNNEVGILRSDGAAEFVDFADIESVELRSVLDRGDLVEGEENERIWSGTYRNSEFGEYSLNAYAEVERYIVIRHAGGVSVFNAYNTKETEKVCGDLAERAGVA